MSKLERKWWFIGMTTAMAVLVTSILFQGAEYRLPFGIGGTPSQYAVFVLSCICLQRGLSFTLWLAALVLAPKTARNEA